MPALRPARASEKAAIPDLMQKPGFLCRFNTPAGNLSRLADPAQVIPRAQPAPAAARNDTGPASGHSTFQRDARPRPLKPARRGWASMSVFLPPPVGAKISTSRVVPETFRAQIAAISRAPRNRVADLAHRAYWSDAGRGQRLAGLVPSKVARPPFSPSASRRFLRGLGEGEKREKGYLWLVQLGRNSSGPIGARTRACAPAHMPLAGCGWICWGSPPRPTPLATFCLIRNPLPR